MKMRQMMRVSASVVALAAMGAGAMAQETEPGFLGKIVVAGTGLPTEVLDSPASVTVIDSDQIERVAPTSVARILERVPGVRVTQSGIERITIRGESSQRVAIMIDGQALTDHTGYGTPILISPASIERIEIVRGSSSVVSGNNAIGGVVNIITKRGADVPFEVTLNSGYLSATNGYRHSANIAGSQGNLDYRLTLSKSDQGDIETPDGPIAESDVQDQEISMHLGYTAGQHYFGLRAQAYDLAANVGTGDPAFSIALPHRDLRKYAAFYEGTDLTPWMTKLRVNAFTQTIDREFRNDITIPIGPGMNMNVLSTSEDVQDTHGISVDAEMQFTDNSRTLAGFSYEVDSQIADKFSLTTSPFGPPAAPTLRYSDAEIRTWSAFAQHEMDFTDALTGTFGLRYYSVDSTLDTYTVNGVDEPRDPNDDSRLLGSFGLTYKPSEDVTWRANISQGYTYPTFSQLYLETTAGGSLTEGNPGLKPETATTYEIGLRMDRGNAVFDGTLFYADAEDYISTQDSGRTTPSGSTIYEYVNVNEARSFGLEVAAEFDTDFWGLRPYVNATWMKREFTYASGISTYDSGTPELSATIGVRRDWELGSFGGEWDLYATGESGSSIMDSSGTIDPDNDTGGFGTLNARITADISDAVSVSFEANNLFDRSYEVRDQYEGAGRNFSLFLTARF